MVKWCLFICLWFCKWEFYPLKNSGSQKCQTGSSQLHFLVAFCNIKKPFMGKNIKKIAIILVSVFTSKAFLDSTYKYHYTVFMGFPDGSAVKNLPAMPETWVQSLGQEDPGKENVNPLQYSCLGNHMHRGAWWASPLGCKNWTRLTDSTTTTIQYLSFSTQLISLSIMISEFIHFAANGQISFSLITE